MKELRRNETKRFKSRFSFDEKIAHTCPHVPTKVLHTTDGEPTSMARLQCVFDKLCSFVLGELLTSLSFFKTATRSSASKRWTVEVKVWQTTMQVGVGAHSLPHDSKTAFAMASDGSNCNSQNVESRAQASSCYQERAQCSESTDGGPVCFCGVVTSDQGTRQVKLGSQANKLWVFSIFVFSILCLLERISQHAQLVVWREIQKRDQRVSFILKKHTKHGKCTSCNLLLSHGKIIRSYTQFGSCSMLVDRDFISIYLFVDWFFQNAFLIVLREDPERCKVDKVSINVVKNEHSLLYYGTICHILARCNGKCAVIWRKMSEYFVTISWHICHNIMTEYVHNLIESDVIWCIT